MKNNPYILVVDDQPQNIELLEAYLIPYGYNIVPAVNGEEALTKLNSFPIDLVLLDVIMPGMNGFEVIRHIRQNENYHQLPIILLTALRERQDRVNGIEAGCDDFISKPIDKIELVARVQSLLKVKAYNDLMNNYRKELEHEVKIRTQQLIKSERQAAYGEIIQGIVHNLRSPLTVITGKVYLTELYGENLNSSDSQNQQNREDNLSKHLDYCKKSLKDIAVATERINQMVDSLLIKSSSDKNENLEIFDLNNTIIRELDFYSADYAYKHKLTKEILLFADPLLIKAVPAVVTQIFDNIFKNAIDELHKVESPFLTVKSGREADFVFFSISDNGRGIPPEIIDKIFNPFFTTKPQSTEDRAKDEPLGTGLGLHFCKNSVEQLGGKIEVASKIGQGSEFKIFFPASN